MLTNGLLLQNLSLRAMSCRGLGLHRRAGAKLSKPCGVHISETAKPRPPSNFQSPYVFDCSIVLYFLFFAIDAPGGLAILQLTKTLALHSGRCLLPLSVSLKSLTSLLLIMCVVGTKLSVLSLERMWHGTKITASASLPGTAIAIESATAGLGHPSSSATTPQTT
jgi:hypothetical protein